MGQALIDKIDPRPAQTRAAVLASALKGGKPMWLLGTFPNLFYAELKPFARRIPGGQGLIIGDSHPNNFGYLQIDGKTVYAPNDFDDGGWGPVALDALHYFTAVQATFNDTALTERLIAEYVRCSTSAKSESRGEPAGGAPDWEKSSRDLLARYTSGDAFKLQKGFKAVSSDEKKAQVMTAVAGALPGGRCFGRRRAPSRLRRQRWLSINAIGCWRKTRAAKRKSSSSNKPVRRRWPNTKSRH